MNTISHQAYSPSYTYNRKKVSLSSFILWCRSQEKYRFGWLAIAIAVHGCFITPLTAFIITSTGNNIILWGIATGAMAMTLVTNLAALPTKITIPTFLLSIMIDIIIIAYSISTGFVN